jgi:hypothetical protein
MVEASTIQPPHCKWGTNRRMSTRKANKVTRSVGRRRMSSARRYRAECDGEWRCAAPARPRHIRLNSAAMGWTTRRAEREWRVAEGRLKSWAASSLPKRSSTPFSMYPKRLGQSNHTSIVPDARTRAPCRGTVSEHTKVHFFKIRNWHAFDYRCREDRE